MKSTYYDLIPLVLALSKWKMCCDVSCVICSIHLVEQVRETLGISETCGCGNPSSRWYPLMIDQFFPELCFYFSQSVRARKKHFDI